MSVFLCFSSFIGVSAERGYIELSGVKKTNRTSNNYSVQAGKYLEVLSNKYHDRTFFAEKLKVREYIISELKKAGYDESQIEVQVADVIGRNIILTVEGKNKNKEIVIGAHYDGSGDGDNGSGVALLLANAVGLSGKKLPVTVKFVFYDLEEIGLFGSKSFVRKMTDEEKKSILFAVNIDSLAFGDYCCIYGGVQDDENKTVKMTEGYDYAMKMARRLGFNTYGTKYLNGYFAKHGTGPKLDPKGVFTNPWTYENPAPQNADTFSPTTGYDVSDHEWFAENNIPYIYFEATNWFADGGEKNKDAYNGYIETYDSTIGKNGMFMNTKYDTLENLEEYFPGRAMEHFNLFSPILSYLILHPEGIK